MSCVIVLAPVVTTLAWPLLVSAATSVMTQIGFSLETENEETEEEQGNSHVEIEVKNAEEVTAGIARGTSVTFTGNGLTVKFSRDTRNHVRICVDGKGQNKDELEAFGQELAGRVIQNFAYQRIVNEMKAGNLTIVNQEMDEDQNIHIQFRGWEE